MDPTEAANSIKQSITMRSCAERYGFPPNRAGFICCPFHSEKTASLKCYEGDRGFSCYGCGENGSVIDFVQRLYGLNFWQAVVRLDYDFNLRLPLGRTITMRERKEVARKEREHCIAQFQRDQKEESARGEYDMRFSWWRLMEVLSAELAPKGSDDEVSDLWVFAIKERAAALEELDIADVRSGYAG